MSGQLKEVRTRITSVVSTQQITKAMKMVSAAKLRKAQDAIIRMRPYAIKMTGILSNLAHATEGDVDIAFAKEREPRRVLIVAITSDRGLCGAFNSQVAKFIRRLIKEKYQKQAAAGDVEIMCIGKKGLDLLKRDGFPTNTDFINLFHGLNFADVSAATKFIKESFAAGRYDRVEVVYNAFKNAATQVLSAEQFLPIARIEEADSGHLQPDFIFEPDMHVLVEQLVPVILDTQFFRYMLESQAAEHGARMTAMDKATENANELLRDLRISYNRARQAAITTELTEIVSGAAALSES